MTTHTDLSVQGIESITFFFPYRKVSGVPVLFLNMAEHIAKYHKIRTQVVDYIDGYMANALREYPHVELIIFQENHLLEIPSNTILIMQSLLPYTIRPELNISSETRIVFWTLHPINFIQTIIPFAYARRIQYRYSIIHRLGLAVLYPGLNQKLRSLIKELYRHKSLFFMDRANLEKTSHWLGVQIDEPIFIPVACREIIQNRRLEDSYRLNTDKISVGWIGRLVDFKINILLYTIQKLSLYTLTNRIYIDMYIIGDGPAISTIADLEVEHKFFNLVWSGVIDNSDLDAYLLENLDILFAMGTSALEGAKLGIPTVLLDITYSPISISKNYKFKWLFQSLDFNLGDFITSENFGEGDECLDELLEQAISNYSELSKITYEYVLRNHSIEFVAEKLLNTVLKSSFQYADFSPDILQKDILRKIYDLIYNIKFGKYLA